MLLRHLLELLLNSPHVDRVESQLLLHPSGVPLRAFPRGGLPDLPPAFHGAAAGGPLEPPDVKLPDGLEMRPWRDEDLTAAARLICAAYRDHPDRRDQRPVPLHSRLACAFSTTSSATPAAAFFPPQVSHVMVDRASRELVALVLGSRVSPQSGHITQLCVHPGYRRRGLARMLLSVAAFHFMRQGASGDLAHRDRGQCAGHRSLPGRRLQLPPHLRCGGVAAGEAQTRVSRGI